MTETEFLTLKQEALRRCFRQMNPQQFEAVTTVKGPVLVLAGAGSGKTTVIVNRIANMVLFGDAAHTPAPVPSDAEIAQLRDYIAGGSMTMGELQSIIAERPVQPWQILAITFTNKAAGELKSRLAETLGDAALDIHASTFHSACVRILRTCIERIGYEKSFTIYDSDDSLRVMKTCMRELDISEKKFPPKSILAAVSHAKDRMISPEQYAREAGTDYWKSVAAKLYKAYQERLHDAQAVDFDDLICLTVRVFEECPDILEKYQRKFRYLMVDEYQDTNYAQYRLVSLLAQGHQNLCVVGDDDQSIYRFRGATIENILQFEEQFAGCKTIRLEENYRSTQHILDAANAVISHNENRKEKKLWTAAGDGEKVHLLKVSMEKDEGQFIADTIEQAVKDGRPYTDFAVLYRMNALSNSVERALMRNKIPYRVYGGVRFQDRKEIRDVTAYLCLLQNPNDSVRFERIVNEPKRGIGDATVNTILQIGHDLHMTPLEVMRNAKDFPALKRPAPLLQFAEMMDGLSELAETAPLDELFDAVLDRTGYKAMLRLQGDEGEVRLENVEEFRSNIKDYMESSESPTLEGFLEENALYTDADRMQDGESVSLMTMHAAKGLEFDTVFAVGMEQNIFPSMRSMDSQEDMEEERRLAYVTITRAKRHLYLIHSQNRLLFGSYKQNPPSRFLREIPQEQLETDDRTIRRMDDMPAEISRSSGLSYLKQAQASAARMQAQKNSPAPALDFAVGERVNSAVFGDGTVLSIEHMGGDAFMEIAFDRVGTKKIMAKHQKLRKI
ncbi:MAG: UvrD-helicase domain-containing protein [Oscillospiraceae bacterium]|nr:UvrD-helicase domain-containing protein [Oscillospiraceae bacterium]